MWCRFPPTTNWQETVNTTCAGPVKDDSLTQLALKLVRARVLPRKVGKLVEQKKTPLSILCTLLAAVFNPKVNLTSNGLKKAQSEDGFAPYEQDDPSGVTIINWAKFIPFVANQIVFSPYVILQGILAALVREGLIEVEGNLDNLSLFDVLSFYPNSFIYHSLNSLRIM